MPDLGWRYNLTIHYCRHPFLSFLILVRLQLQSHCLFRNRYHLAHLVIVYKTMCTFVQHVNALGEWQKCKQCSNIFKGHYSLNNWIVSLHQHFCFQYKKKEIEDKLLIFLKKKTRGKADIEPLQSKYNIATNIQTYFSLLECCQAIIVWMQRQFLCKPTLMICTELGTRKSFFYSMGP